MHIWQQLSYSKPIGHANGTNNHVKFALYTKEWVNSVNHNTRCQYTHTLMGEGGGGERE
jgi:hypothetical protein